MNEIPHPGFDKPEKYETFTTTNDLEEAANKHLDKLFGKGKHQKLYLDLFKAGAEWAFNQFECKGSFTIPDPRGGYWPSEPYYVRKK